MSAQGDPGDPRAVGAELASRLDAVLGIAERLAVSHDRDHLFRTIVDESRRALGVDHVVIHTVDGEWLRVVAWAGMDEATAATLPVIHLEDGCLGEVMRGRRVSAWPDLRRDPRHDPTIYPESVVGALSAPLVHHDEAIGTLTAVTAAPRAWTLADEAFLSSLATHAGIALTNAELFARTEDRAAQLAALQAASGRLSRASSVEGVGRIVVEEARRVIDYHNARVYLVELPDQVVPIAFEGRVGAYEHVDMDLLRCRLGEGFSGWVAQHGEPILANDANADPRGSTIVGTDDIDESMIVVPMRYDGITIGVITLSKLGLGGFDDDDLRVLTILADQAATAVESARLLSRSQALARELRRLLDMSGELSGSLDPRQVANLMAGHFARAMDVDECAISYWDRATDRLESLGYYPPIKLEEMEPYFDVSGYPQTLRALRDETIVTIDAEDPAADPAEVALLRKDGNRMLAMLPLIAKGEAIGLVELFSRGEIHADAERLELARTMANEAAMALENAWLYEDVRKLADRDPLTGFANHRYLHERLGEEIVRSQRGRQPLSLLMIDLDDFKLVNDTFGHLFGDRVLTWTAEIIRSTLRSSDLPARYGGDEFAVILPETDPVEARVVAERILEAFRTRSFVGEQRGPVPVALSIGVATVPVDARTPTELIAAADAALYRVKRAGGHDAAAAGGHDAALTVA
jgi:diguanylate cyclase (GGDEF)-like protein